jgi:hypothetical protein
MQLASLASGADNARAMVNLPLEAVHGPLCSIPVGENQRQNSAQPVIQPLFRFGLKQLFWFVGVCSFLLAGIVLSDGLTTLALSLAALVVLAHVFGTALGSRLRAQSDREHTWRSLNEAAESDGLASLGAPRLPTLNHSRSPWHGRRTTALPWLPRLIIAGVLSGGVGGGILLAMIIGHRTSMAGICVGAISLAVLGGWFSFLGGSFYGIFRHGLREALADQRRDETSVK